MEQEIIGAISEHRVLSFDYQGQPRQVNPHALGRVKPDDKAVLHAWQTGGSSNHRIPPCWGYFRLDEIQRLLVTDEIFPSAQPDFKPRFVNLIHRI
jgi:WYL domain-containing protein